MTAMSAPVGFFGSSGSRARLPASAGLSLAKPTSSSWSPEIARMQTGHRALEGVGVDAGLRPCCACCRRGPAIDAPV